VCRLSQRTLGHFDHDRKDFDQQVFKVVIFAAEVLACPGGWKRVREEV